MFEISPFIYKYTRTNVTAHDLILKRWLRMSCEFSFIVTFIFFYFDFLTNSIQLWVLQNSLIFI